MLTDSPQLWTDDERWQVLMENVKDFGIFMLDADGHFATWNVGAERVLGFTAEEILGLPFSTIFTPEDIELQQPQFEFREAREKGRCEDERWHVRKDGSRFWASGVLTPLWTARGVLRGFAKVVRDITERKMAELAVTEANRRKDEFLAILSHEFRNPLSAIMNAAQILKLEASQGEATEQATSVIQRQGEGLIRIVDDLLDISRINNGKFQLLREQVDLRDALASALEAAAPLIQGRQHDVRYVAPEEPIWLEADPHRLRQIFLNLLANAAKYTTPGGQIAVVVSNAGPQATVRIKDDGAGIVSEMLPRIFELFVQVDNSTERSSGGLGIGLSLVKRLVEMHGGKVEAYSDGIGKGSEFVVQLPIRCEREFNTSALGDDVFKAPRSGGKILIAEDNSDAAVTMALLLKKCGYQVTIASSGPEALQLVDELRPDAAILDIGLPGMDGCQVAQLIRNRPELAQIRLLALSGYGNAEDQQRSRQAGFEAHLIKPVEFATLLKLLDGSRQANA
ncbi:MAG: PAS domain S-box protein [Planctomycetes bacterium]|nr:PAS domain S-box protein [Planctomycetota bacterium]